MYLNVRCFDSEEYAVEIFHSFVPTVIALLPIVLHGLVIFYRWSFFYTARLLAAQCIVIGHVCVFVVGRRANGRTGGRAGGVCYHDNSKVRSSIFTKLGL